MLFRSRHQSRPVPVIGLGDVIAIAAGQNHSLALKRDSTVWAWGGNDRGQLGDGSQLQRLTPVPVVGLTPVTRIAAGVGARHSLAITQQDLQAWSWGDNRYGQLGLGQTDDRAHAIPQKIPNSTQVADLAGGWKFTLMVKTDATVRTFGNNDSGQLGDGTFAGHVTPALPVSQTVTNLLTLDKTQQKPPEANIPPEANPCFLVRTNMCGSLESRSLEVDVYGLFGISGDGMPKPSRGERELFQGLCGEIDAVGMPKPVRGERSISRPFCPFIGIDATGMPKPNARELSGINLYVAALTPNGTLYQLDAHGAWGPLTQPMASYRLNVDLNEKTQKVYTPILNNADLTGLVGARFFVGYGVDSNEMIKAGRYREILTVTDPNAM
ncbi:hypothetical protein CCP4SC76_7580001 [Gammaproteobacteria bacterium]